LRIVASHKISASPFLFRIANAHFDHFDLRTLHRFDKDTSVIPAPNTADLLRWTRFRNVTELRWGQPELIFDKVSREETRMEQKASQFIGF
jgi:L-ascorbate metabolism protein UlaG (beta-lactamase superfamily)